MRVAVCFILLAAFSVATFASPVEEKDESFIDIATIVKNIGCDIANAAAQKCKTMKTRSDLDEVYSYLSGDESDQAIDVAKVLAAVKKYGCAAFGAIHKVCKVVG